MYKRGTIILVPFPFTDLSSQRVRPALIISREGVTGDDVIVLFISSVVPVKPEKTDLLVSSTYPAFKTTGLKTSSVFRCDKIATLDKRIVLGELGTLSSTLQKEIDQKLRFVLKLS